MCFLKFWTLVNTEHCILKRVTKRPLSFLNKLSTFVGLSHKAYFSYHTCFWVGHHIYCTLSHQLFYIIRSGIIIETSAFISWKLKFEKEPLIVLHLPIGYGFLLQKILHNVECWICSSKRNHYPYAIIGWKMLKLLYSISFYQIVSPLA